MISDESLSEFFTAQGWACTVQVVALFPQQSLWSQAGFITPLRLSTLPHSLWRSLSEWRLFSCHCIMNVFLKLSLTVSSFTTCRAAALWEDIQPLLQTFTRSHTDPPTVETWKHAQGSETTAFLCISWFCRWLIQSLGLWCWTHWPDETAPIWSVLIYFNEKSAFENN